MTSRASALSSAAIISASPADLPDGLDRPRPLVPLQDAQLPRHQRSTFSRNRRSVILGGLDDPSTPPQGHERTTGGTHASA